MSEECQLLINPSFIDFGCLQPGVGAKAIIRVAGGPARATTDNELIQVTPSEVGEEAMDIEVMVGDGAAGDLIWDTLHVQGDKGEIDIPVICLWDEALSYSFKEPIRRKYVRKATKPVEPEQETGATVIDDIPVESNFNPPVNEDAVTPTVSERTYVGQSCRYCGRNLRYDSDNKIWLKCDKCIGARIIISVPLQLIHDTKLGIKKDGKKLLRDMWEVITGKQDWNLR